MALAGLALENHKVTYKIPDNETFSIAGKEKSHPQKHCTGVV
jgi:hypothetical protein